MRNVGLKFAVVLSFIILFSLEGCAPKITPLPVGNIDELIGTWANPEYNGTEKFAKIVWKTNGTVDFFRNDSDEKPDRFLTFKVKEKWRSSDGVVYVKIVRTLLAHTDYYILLRISSDGKFVEENVSSTGHPQSIDYNSDDFNIMYRR